MKTKKNNSSRGWKGQNILLLSILSLLVSSCYTPYQILQVDIQQPAAVTTPVDIAKVLVVNNSVPQSKTDRFEIFFDREEIRLKEPFSTDTMVWFVANELGSTLHSAGFFNEVAVYKEPLRTDEEWLAIVPLTEEFRRKVFEEQGFDAIISIDRVLFTMSHHLRLLGKTTKEITDWNFSELPIHADMKIWEQISCSLYTYNRNIPMTSFSLTDSITYKGVLEANSQAVFYDLPELAMRELSIDMGANLAEYFVPTWISQERILYIGSNSRMKEAASYFNSKKPSRALHIWTNRYSTTSKPIDQVKLALNIALAYEIQDQYDEALAWLQKGKSNSEPLRSTEEKPAEVSYLDYFLTELEKRIKASPLLDLQLEGK